MQCAHNCTITRKCIVCVMNTDAMATNYEIIGVNVSYTLGGGDARLLFLDLFCSKRTKSKCQFHNLFFRKTCGQFTSMESILIRIKEAGFPFAMSNIL